MLGIVKLSIGKEHHQKALTHDLNLSELTRWAIDVSTNQVFMEEKKLEDQIKRKIREANLLKKKLIEVKEKRIERDKLEAMEKKKKENQCPLCNERYTLKNKKIIFKNKEMCKNCFHLGVYQ